MKQRNAKTRVCLALLLSFLLTGLYFAAVYLNLPIVYDINDDVAMRNVAAGVITGEPDGHLIFVKYILGLFLAGLYKLLPGFDWYGITMIGTILLSLAMVLYRGLAALKTMLWKIGYVSITLLLFTCIGMQHIVTFQWTVSAAFAGAAGIYLFYTVESEERFQVIAEESMAVFLLLLCLLIRQSVFLMVLPVAAVCFWWKYGTIDFRNKCPICFKHLAVPVVLFLGTVLILGVEQAAYRSKEWNTFLSYNSDRSAIMDYYGLANYEDNAEFYDSLELTPEEVENLQRYSLYLTDEVYAEKMHLLAVNARETQLAPYSLGEQVRMAVKKVYDHFQDDTYMPIHEISFLLMAAVCILGFFKDKKQFALALVLNVLMGLLWLYLGFRGRIVDRVGYSMYLVTCLSMFAVGYQILFVGEQGIKKKWPWAMVTVSVCVILAVLSGQKWNAVKGHSSWRSAYNREFLDVNTYMAEHPENVYFMTTFSIETYTDNFTIQRDFDFSNLLSVGGWHTFSPLENVKKEKLGITDPKRDIAETEDVYVISLQNVNLRYMDRFYKSLYGERFKGRILVDALEIGDSIFEVYDFGAKE